MKTYVTTLSIAGSDSSGGAGIQADIKTFSALGCYGMSVITALTAQNTKGVQAIQSIPASFIENQLNSIFDDIEVNAIKTGMLFSENIIKVIVKILQKHKEIPIVIDPVMVSKNGSLLLKKNAIKALITHLFPLATLLTPNIPEAEYLLSAPIKNQEDMEKAAVKLCKIGAKAVLIKGGHLYSSQTGFQGKAKIDPRNLIYSEAARSEQQECISTYMTAASDEANKAVNQISTGIQQVKESYDCLYIEKERVLHWFSSPRISTNNTHGTGCTLSAAITAFLAKGENLYDAVDNAKNYIFQTIKLGSEYKFGSLHGPVYHFAL